MTQDTYSFMDVDMMPRCHTRDTGGHGHGHNVLLILPAILDIDDELADDEVPLPHQIPGGYFLVSSAPAALTAALAKQSIVLRLGVV